MSFYRAIKRLIGGQGKRLVPSVLLSFLDSFLNSCMYLVMFMALISLTEGSFTAERLVKYAWGMLAVFVLRIIVQSVAFTNAQCTGADISYHLRTILGNHIHDLNLGFFNKNSTGKLNSVLLTDVGDFEAIITHCLCDEVKTLSFLLIAAVFSFLLDVRYGIMVLIVMASAFPLLLRSGRVSGQQTGNRKEASRSAATRIVEYITGMKTFRLYNMIGRRFEKLDDALSDLKEESVKSELRLLPLAMGFSAVNGMLIPASLIMGTWLYHGGELGVPGFLVMILMSIAISSTMTSASALYPQLCSIEKSTESITEFLDIPSMEYDLDVYPAGNGEIRFEHVNFAYDDVDVLHDISLCIRPGTVTALVGSSGAGKTTVMSLLARFWDVTGGRITINGTDIRSVDPDVLTAHMGIVFQDVYLFADTVYNNIKLGAPQATKEQVVEAARAAQCHDFIMQMEDGYDTMIGEGGATLSGGERQRIAVARALIRDAPIVLLDETTSSLDADNEREIQLAFERLMRGRTVIVIAHRLNTIRNADQIFVLKDGRIAEQGSHDSLMQNKNSWYRHMIEEQEKAGKWHVIQGGNQNDT